MKKTGIILFLLSISCSFLIKGQELPERQTILKQMELANSYFMQKWPDVGKTIITTRERPSNIWTRGVYYEGLMAFYGIYPKQEFYDYSISWAEFHQWGMRNGNTTRNGDDQCCGQTYIDLYNIEPDPVKIKNIKVCMEMLLNTPQLDDWSWIDAIQMGMPVFAKLGTTLHEPRYYDKMWDLYAFCRNEMAGSGLYNPEDGLWWRDGDFIPPYKEPNGEDCYWSRGNGWVYAALVRVLSEIPIDEKHRNDYIRDFQSMTDALVKCQREDGFWNVSLHDPSNFGGKEVTGTSLFVYGMAWGINNGLLNREQYLPVVVKAWNAIIKEAVHPNGFLGYVQGTGKEPRDGQPVTYDSMPDFEDYGIGCFLLAGVEVYKLR
jgi:rhamnogalacturonyl hydrolase YesR